jgi:hypothetical protein
MVPRCDANRTSAAAVVDRVQPNQHEKIPPLEVLRMKLAP